MRWFFYFVDNSILLPLQNNVLLKSLLMQAFLDLTSKYSAGLCI